PRLSYPTSTDTNGNPSSATDDATAEISPWPRAGDIRRADVDGGRGGAADADRSAPRRRTGFGRSAGGRPARGRRHAHAGQRPRGTHPERDQQPAAGGGAGRERRSGDAARSAAHRAVVGTVPARRRG